MLRALCADFVLKNTHPSVYEKMSMYLQCFVNNIRMIHRNGKKGGNQKSISKIFTQISTNSIYCVSLNVTSDTDIMKISFSETTTHDFIR